MSVQIQSPLPSYDAVLFKSNWIFSNGLLVCGNRLVKARG